MHSYLFGFKGDNVSSSYELSSRFDDDDIHNGVRGDFPFVWNLLITGQYHILLVYNIFKYTAKLPRYAVRLRGM